MEHSKYKIKVRRTTFVSNEHETNCYDGDVTYINDYGISLFNTKNDAKKPNRKRIVEDY